MTDKPRLNAVDMSKWGGELTAEEAACMVAAGIRLLIVGDGWAGPGGSGEFAAQQADSWLAAGGEALDAYVYLYMAGDPRAQVRNALATLGTVRPVRRWWLDAEDTESPQLTPAQRIEFLLACISELGERRIGIYSGRWWWVPNMANSTEFAGFPLWNSYYDGYPDEDGLPYGGWEHSAIEQYQGTTDVCGQSCDLNYAKDLEDDMTAIEDTWLAMFAGSEQPGDRAARLAYAKGRVAEIAAGSAPSLVETGAAFPVANGGTPIDAKAVGRAIAQAGSIITQAGVNLQGGA